MPFAHFDSDLIDPTPGVACADRAEEVTYVSKTRLLESQS
jgi:hypothetical protein